MNPYYTYCILGLAKLYVHVAPVCLYHEGVDEQGYYRVSVKGIVIDEQGRILLSRELDDRWDALGGGLDHEEDPIIGLKREVLEETGLEVTYVSPSPKFFNTAPRVGTTMTTYTANIFYEIKLQDLHFTPSDECQELRFFSITEMEKVNLIPNIQKLLQTLKENAV